MYSNIIESNTPEAAGLGTGESPYAPEYEDFIKNHPGRGTLKIQVSAAREAYPVEDVAVEVSLVYSGKRFTLYRDVTDSSGIVNNLALPAGSRTDTQTPDSDPIAEAHYLVSVYHPSFKPVTNCLVTVYDRIETILPITLSPVPGSGGV